MKCLVNRFFFPQLLALFICLAGPVLTWGAVSWEISHLLQYIEESGCTFIRNGSEYSALEARQHIERKYEYLKSRLSSAEDFIDHAATKSSMTGRQYTVVCSDEEMLTGAWLKKELEQFRVKQD